MVSSAIIASEINMYLRPRTGTDSNVQVNIPTVGLYLKACLPDYVVVSLANCLPS